MLNIVLDNLPYSNVWYPAKTYNRDYSDKHNKPLPWFLHPHDNLTFHTSADGLASFIYPVLMHEPYIQVRSIIANHNPFGGFWSRVSDNVIEALREKRGWIIIDIYSEPISQYDFDAVINSLNDSSQFPNDRILLNTTSPHFAKHERVFNYSSFLESSCYFRHIDKKYRGPCPCNPASTLEIDYPHKRFLLLNSNIDYRAAEIFSKYASENLDVFLDSSDEVNNVTLRNPYVDPEFSTKYPKYLMMPEALYATDFNVVLEAYVDYEVVEYPFITEKTYRNMKYKKPFVVIGQKHTLACLHKLGYKTFHPLIDERYDTEWDNKDRTKGVIRELERLKSMSDDEWSSFMELCKPIVEHNYNNLLKRIKQTNDWLEGLKDL
jgi:hypothetical protein